MLRWSPHLDGSTSRPPAPVWEVKMFSSLLEVTFSLAVNETKQQRVIKANVFIEGFYRKLISRGMRSCAKLMGGSWHSCREAAVSESCRICICIHPRLSIQTRFTWISKCGKKVGDVVRLKPRGELRILQKPSEIICPVVAGGRKSLWNFKKLQPWLILILWRRYRLWHIKMSTSNHSDQAVSPHFPSLCYARFITSWLAHFPPKC